MRQLPPTEELRAAFSFDESTGALYHRGREVRGDRGNGYLHVRAFGYLWYAHRIVYALANDRDPYPLQVDHINGDRKDNRPINLQLATNQQNVQRRVHLSKNNKSGHRGVYWHAGKWTAGIKANGKNQYLGRFNSIEEAVAARKAAEHKYDYPKGV